jgi:hypothetical protein
MHKWGVEIMVVAPKPHSYPSRAKRTQIFFVFYILYESINIDNFMKNMKKIKTDRMKTNPPCRA